MKKILLLAATVLHGAGCADQLATDLDDPLADASSGVTNPSSSPGIR